ncbi:MAG: DNA-3-methyladenine glycosylase 2 family protein [Saprospiraceae bacterium]|uniref:DNA-3-methyladenine glycosylase II n=1 Tax=Candidatus Opimibacter skivensis TaxID=2982028 RepID=A0A9D7SXU1_9BACT|nr:DNA-3-methyladenine glycosylase 2 family protein [Candidatus Opimibacter skivensis]
MNDIVNDEDIRTLFTKDKTFEHIHHLYGTPPNWSRPQGFVSLSKTILEQQVSLASANAHFQKLNGYIKEFTPSEILSLSDEEMKACQISRQKAKYLRELSTAILERKLNLDELSNLDEADVRTRLMAIKGIGTWTSDIYLMFCLQAKDIFPLGDIAVINTVKELTDIHNREEIYKLSEKWKPLRSLAAYFFWHYYLCKRRR